MAAVKAAIEDLRAQQEQEPRPDATSAVILYAGSWGYCPVGLPLLARDDQEIAGTSGA
jgi:hypothetical protein